MSKKYSTFVPDDQNGYKQYDWGFGFEVLVDEPDTSTMYIGYAVPGTVSSEAKWLIMKVSESGTVSTKRFTNNDCKRFDQIWDNRASLSYEPT